jgi:hypothetical protein
MRFRNSVASSIALITLAASLAGCYGSSSALPTMSETMAPYPRSVKPVLPRQSSLYSPQIQYGPQVSARLPSRTPGRYLEQGAVYLRCSNC